MNLNSAFLNSKIHVLSLSRLIKPDGQPLCSLPINACWIKLNTIESEM